MISSEYTLSLSTESKIDCTTSFVSVKMYLIKFESLAIITLLPEANSIDIIINNLYHLSDNGEEEYAFSGFNVLEYPTTRFIWKRYLQMLRVYVSDPIFFTIESLRAQVTLIGMTRSTVKPYMS